MIPDGLHVYIGTTGSGKTHKAIRDAIELAGTKRLGVLVIDSRGANNLREIQELRPGKELWEQVWNYGSIRRVVPRDETEFDEIIRRVDQTGQLILVIDECAPWANNKTFHNLCRVWRHRNVTLFITTQKIGRDIEQTILACDPTMYVFRLTNPRSLEWVERWHRIPENELRQLEVGQYFMVSF
jgi:DNA helicase HerA-like ATPase